MSDRAGGAEQELAERSVATMLAGDAFSAWLGLRLVQVRPGACIVAMKVREEMLNGFGVCHGGVTFALADSALAFACNTGGRVTVSIENAISYPAPVHAGDDLEAVAEEESATARLAFYRVLVRRGGDTVAIFRGTVYRTGRALLAPAATDPPRAGDAAPPPRIQSRTRDAD